MKVSQNHVEPFRVAVCSKKWHKALVIHDESVEELQRLSLSGRRRQIRILGLVRAETRDASRSVAVATPFLVFPFAFAQQRHNFVDGEKQKNKQHESF